MKIFISVLAVGKPGLELVAAALEPPPAEALAEEGIEGRAVWRGGVGDEAEAGLLAGDQAEVAFEQGVFAFLERNDGEAGGFDDVAEGGRQKHDGVGQMEHAETAPAAGEVGDFEQEGAAVGEPGAEGAEGFDGIDTVFEDVEGGGVGVGWVGGREVFEGGGDDASTAGEAEFAAEGGGFDTEGFDGG
jgi:hypothetical protein